MTDISTTSSVPSSAESESEAIEEQQQQQQQSPVKEPEKPAKRRWPRSPFPVDASINQRVELYDGDLKSIEADAIVNPTNESLSQLSYVIDVAGAQLEAYVKKRSRVCPTADVRLSPGFQSQFKYIIHAVPPKYQPKYRTAAETALFHTYFKILTTMIEKKIRSVVMPILVTPRCQLPVDDNLEMQLRVVRRMLEKRAHDFDKIIIHVECKERFLSLYHCYFPHTAVHEENACFLLDDNVGGTNGEPVIPGREIRIKGTPGAFADRSIDLSSGLDLSCAVGKTAFSKMREDLVAHRRFMTMTPNNNNNNQQIAIRRKRVFRGCVLV